MDICPKLFICFLISDDMIMERPLPDFFPLLHSPDHSRNCHFILSNCYRQVSTAMFFCFRCDHNDGMDMVWHDHCFIYLDTRGMPWYFPQILSCDPSIWT